MFQDLRYYFDLFMEILDHFDPYMAIYIFKSSCPISTIELSFRPFLSQVKPLIIPEVDIIRVQTPKQNDLNKYLKKTPRIIHTINNDISKLLI